MRAISILALGSVEPRSVAALATHFSTIEQVDLPIPPRSALDAHRAAVNRGLDACSHLWVFILREREVVSAELAREIAAHVVDGAMAWGCRVRTEATYLGRPLRLETKEEGEIRLLHRRHSRFALGSSAREIKVEGPIVRLGSALELQTFGSIAEHRIALERQGIARGATSHLLIFVREVVLSGLWHRGLTAMCYVWVETGYDRRVTLSPGERE